MAPSHATLGVSRAVFLHRPDHGIDPARAAALVAERTGISPLRQRLAAARLALGPGRLSPADYYRFGLWRGAREPGLFLGEASYRWLNALLAPDRGFAKASLIQDKLLFGLFARAAGLPVPVTQAHFSTRRRVPAVPHLGTAEELERFLAGPARLPLFGKPDGSAYAVGTLSVRARSRDGTRLTLGSGETVGARDLAQNLARRFAGGYLFQDHLAQHDIPAAACGQALGTLRIQTLRSEAGPVTAYALQRIPGTGAMSDAVHHPDRQTAEIDHQTGQVLAHFQGDRTFGMAVAAARFSGLAYPGTILPFWPEVLALVTTAHAMFPDTASIGWDVALTPEGPVLVEGAVYPFQLVWQVASGKPLLSPRLAGLFLHAMDVTRQRGSAGGFGTRRLLVAMRGLARISTPA